MKDTESVLKLYVFAQSDGQEVDLDTLQIDLRPIEAVQLRIIQKLSDHVKYAFY